MTDPELIRRAEAAGIAPCYLDWREQKVEGSEETLAAILDALDSAPRVTTVTPATPVTSATSATGATGATGATAADAATDVLARPRVPDGRSWGFTIQLYSVRSR